MNKKGAGQYLDINAQTGVIDADPHRLIQMLYAGAIDRIAVAKGCMQRDDIAGKGAAISKAIGIVGGLRDSVNTDMADKSLPDNLSSLYEYVTQRLTDANIKNDAAGLDEATNILKELQAGWNDIRAEVLAQSQADLTSA